uniref:uncharacterized protein LOC778729 n=1 Tax=Ciona intestinalis TaxID=7719 RepID=UPI0002B8DDC4|nr:uncharacterized protein LOC778729 [Ciona intestinalis]|eukprot:XP_002122285.4 uncharacterized protein LOC778729 [Ciona intestinalis]
MSFAANTSFTSYITGGKLNFGSIGISGERPNFPSPRVALPDIGKIMREERSCLTVPHGEDAPLHSENRTVEKAPRVSPTSEICSVNITANPSSGQAGAGLLSNTLNRAETFSEEPTHFASIDAAKIDGHLTTCHSAFLQSPCATFSEMLRDDVTYGFCYKADSDFYSFGAEENTPALENSSNKNEAVVPDDAPNTELHILQKSKFNNTNLTSSLVRPTSFSADTNEPSTLQGTTATEFNNNDQVLDKDTTQTAIPYHNLSPSMDFSPSEANFYAAPQAYNNLPSSIATPNSEKMAEAPEMSSSILDDLDLSDINNSSMEKMEREYFNEAIKEVYFACSLLNLPPDPILWSKQHVEKWVMWTTHQCRLPALDVSVFRMPGTALCRMTERDMHKLAPSCGDILHARLEIWRSAVGSQLLQSNEYQEIEENMGVPPPAAETGLFSLKPKHLNCQSNYSTEVITDNKMMISTAIHTRSKLEDTNSSAAALTPNYSSGIHLWQFLKELLLQPQSFSRYIRWIDKQRGIFKIEDSVEVARLWGVRKNRPAMNYDKLSRSIRQYYKKGIIRKTKVSQRLVYQFVEPTHE